VRIKKLVIPMIHLRHILCQKQLKRYLLLYFYHLLFILIILNYIIDKFNGETLLVFQSNKGDVFLTLIS
jgi:hypothetical protein